MKSMRKIFAILFTLALLASSLVMFAFAADDEPAEAPYEHVVILGVDALGSFGTRTDTPNIDAIFADGASTYSALVENPSSSAEGWGSLLIGVSADVHGLTNYSIMDGAYSNDALPTIFKLLKDQKPDATMASYCCWNSINNGIIENINGLEKKQVSDANMPSAINQYFATNGDAPNLLFCQFNNLDAVGHSIGYGGPEFLDALQVIDGYIGDIYEIYENAGILDKTLFIVTGDHGGINTTHGGWSPEEKYVFYGVAGKGVNEMSDFDMFIRDTPAIVSYALGLKGTEGWDSYVPENLFVDGDALLKRPPSAPNLVYPNTTPEESNEKYIGNYINVDDLKAGFFFDGDLSNFVEGSDVELNRYVGAYGDNKAGTIYYPKGLYSEGVKVSYEGYLATDDLDLDNNSFSIGLWACLDEMNSAQLLWSTKRWTDADGVGNFKQQGLLIRNVYVNSDVYLGLNIGSGKYSVGGTEQTPGDANYYYDAKNQYTPKEWVHTLMVVDRENKVIKYYVNFELAITIDLSTKAWFNDDYDIDPHDLFVLGQDITGVYPKSLEGKIDDLLVFNKAINATTISSLKEYYSDALYDFDYAVDGEHSVSTSSTEEIKFENGSTNTDNTPFTKIEANILSGSLSESAKYIIANGFDLSNYSNAKYYVVDFDIATSSIYLPMNFSALISGNNGSQNIASVYNGITADGVLVGSLNGVEVTRTLSTSPYAWQHITLAYDLVGGNDGYPLYIYFNGDLISNSEWMSAQYKQSGEAPAAISAIELVIDALASNDDYLATTLIANATSKLYIDDIYGNIDAFFKSGAGMIGANKVLDLVYSAKYALPAFDYMFSSNGVGYRTLAEALSSGNGVIDVLHSDIFSTYQITDPCTVNTNGCVFNFEIHNAVKKTESLDASGNKVYIFESEAPLYTLTLANGNVKNYYQETCLKEILATATTGSTIKLFADIDVTADYECYSKILNIDLNGNTVTNNGGYLRIFSGACLNFYNGNIVDSNAKEFIYIGAGASSAVANITNCVITADRNFAEVRCGTVNLTDCTYTHTGNYARLANCASGSNEGDVANLKIDGCTINLGSALLVSAVRADSYPKATSINITINDSEIKTTANLFNLQNKTAGAADSVTNITVTGQSKLAFNKFDVGGFTVPNTTVSFAAGVKFSAQPTVTGAKIVLPANTVIGESGDSDYPYGIVKESEALYTITTKDGVVTKYYEVMGLRALIGLAPAGSTITLYSNIDLSDTSETYVKQDLTIDLNGYAISNTGERINALGNCTLTLKNGTLNDCGTTTADGKYDDNDFLDIPASGNANTYIIVDNCDIIANGFFFDIKAGNLIVKNSTFVQGGKKNGAFANMLAAGKTATLTVENTEIELTGTSFVTLNRASSYSDAIAATVTVKDSNITTSSSLFSLTNTTSGATSSSITITITGNTYLKYASFDGNTCGVTNTKVLLGTGVKMSAMPTVAKGTVALLDTMSEIKSTNDTEYPYEVSEIAGYLYSVTASDGVVTKYYEEMGLQTLIGLAPAGSTITLYSNIDLSHTTETYVTKDLTIDLNGFEITNTGERLRVQGSCTLTLKNGTLNDCGTVNADGSYKDKDFINIPASGSADTYIVVDNCDIIANGFFIDIKAGNLTVKNSTFKQGGKKNGAFANMLAAGTTATLTVDNCEIELTGTSFVTLNRASSYSDAITATVTVKNSNITTSSSLFSLTNTTSGAASSSITITITGNTYLKYASFDGNTCGVSNTTVSLGKGVRMSANPTVAKGTIALIEGGKYIVNTNDADYPYMVSDVERCYTITKSDKTVVYIYEVKSLQDLVALADSGSVIKLFTDVEITAALSITNKNIELDLNGNTITSNVRTRLEGSTNLYIHDGKIVDGAADFVFIGAGYNSVVFKIESCDVTISGKLLDARAGKVEVIDSTFVNTTGGAFLLSSQGTKTTFVATGSTFNLGAASFISTSRGNYSDAANTDVSIHNCVVNTTGMLFYLLNEYTPDISEIKISITGSETKLTYGSFDGDTCTVPNTTITLGLGVKMNKAPEMKIGNIKLGEGAVGIAKGSDSDCPLEVVDKIPLPVKPRFSLTLYTDFTLNLCLSPEDNAKINSIVVDGQTIEPFYSEGMYFYQIKNIAAYNAAESKTIYLSFTEYGITNSVSINYSVIDYANGLLASNYSTESKEMLCRAIEYVASAYNYAGIDVPASVTAFLESDGYKAISNDEWVGEIPESNTDKGGMNSIIASAQIDLNSELRFRFNIKAGVNCELLVSSATVNEVFVIENGLCGGKSYIEVKMRAFDMYNGIITFKSGDLVGTYDLRAYANSGAIEKDTTGMLNDLLLSLYNYCREANEYARVQYKDFESTAKVVLKDGKSGTVTYVVDDGRADTAARLEPMLDDYENLKLTFALIANKYATLKTEYNDETGKYEYVFDENGNYVYTVNEEAAKYWRDLITKYADKVEYSNHSFTHGFAGYNDEGGTVSYVDTSGNIRTVTLPVGSSTAELYAAVQVFKDLFGVDVETLVMPGVPANRTDVVIDGVTYPGWFPYYLEIVEQMYEDGILIGMRGDGFGEANMGKSYIIMPEDFVSADQRLNITSYTMKDINSFESWTQYIDYAIESGGWANFCLHQIFEDGTVSEAFHLKVSQARALFSYTNRDDVWVANYAEAAKYYAEWATAEVSVECNDGVISVTLTDAENNEVYDEALTVKVTVPTGWTECVVGDKTVEVMVGENGESFVYVNIVPDSGVVTITSK